jgi:3-dehydroquinate synthase
VTSIGVNLKARSYRIHIGPLKSGLASAWRGALPQTDSIFIVTSRAIVTAGHLKTLRRSLPANVRIAGISILDNGESVKTLRTFETLHRRVARAKLHRLSAIVALGGGVVTDLAGFVAATYMRGVAFVSVPTTLLGMVDAAIGGKTGVDLPEGKNLVGAFWQPKLVWLDAALLKTLPPREWRTGFAEVAKYGVILDAAFFGWLEKQIARQPAPWKWSAAAVEKILRVSAACKAGVVGADERETPLKGGREILNYGHTVGHALEAATGYRAFTHGEAIAIGMVVAGRLALGRGLWSSEQQSRQARLFAAVGLPTVMPRLSSAQTKRFWSALASDKKNIGGALRFILPEKIGRVRVIGGIEKTEVQSAIA